MKNFNAKMLLVIVSLIVYFSTPANAEQATPTLNQEVKDLREKVEAMEKQQGSFWEELEKKITLGGYGTLEYEKFQNTQNTFDGHKIELLISMAIHDRIRLYNEIEFERASAISNAPAGNRGGTVEVEQAYVDFLIARGINIRGGVIVVPFGKFNLDHFEPRKDLTERPIIARRVVPTTWPDVGFGIFGDIRVAEPLSLSYEIYAINGLNGNFSTTNGGLRNARPGFEADNNTDKTVVGRLAFKFLDDQYEIGLSGYRGAYDATSDSEIKGYDFDYDFRPRYNNFWERFEFKGEYARFHVDGSALSKLWGLYSEVDFHFWPSFLNKTFMGKYFEKPTFTLVFRYDHAKIRTTAGTGNLKEHRYTFGWNYRPVEEFVLKTEYQVNRGQIERGGNNGFISSINWLF